MEMETWRHPATQVKLIEEYEDISHPIQAYTVGAGIAIFLDNNPKSKLKYRLNGQCTTIQAEETDILKALEYI